MRAVVMFCIAFWRPPRRSSKAKERTLTVTVRDETGRSSQRQSRCPASSRRQSITDAATHTQGQESSKRFSGRIGQRRGLRISKQESADVRIRSGANPWRSCAHRSPPVGCHRLASPGRGRGSRRQFGRCDARTDRCAVHDRTSCSGELRISRVRCEAFVDRSKGRNFRPVLSKSLSSPGSFAPKCTMPAGTHRDFTSGHGPVRGNCDGVYDSVTTGRNPGVGVRGPARAMRHRENGTMTAARASLNFNGTDSYRHGEGRST